MCVYCQKYEMASDTPPDVNTYYKPHDKKANDKQSVWHYFLIEMPSKKLQSVNNVPKQYIGAYTEPAHKNPDKIRTSRFGVKKVAKNPDFPKWNGYANTTCQVHVSRNPCYCCFCILASRCKAKLCSWATIFEDKKQKWLKAEDAVWSPLLSTDTAEAGKPPLSGMM